jgi:hypothetical protein
MLRLQKPDSQTHVQFLILKIMKKILFISLFCCAIGFFTSCTADDVTDQAMSVSADDTGGQHGVITPPPPPVPTIP